MRHRRNYAHVRIWGRKSSVGFLGAPYPFGLSPGNVLDVAIISVAAFAIYIGMT